MQSTVDSCHSSSDRDEASLAELLDSLKDVGSGDTVSANDVLAAFSGRSLGVILTLLGLIAALPVIGAIPGISIAISVITLLAIGSSILGSGQLYAPDIIGSREVGRDKLERAAKTAKPYAEWIDNLLKPRLEFLIDGDVQRAVVIGVCALLAISMIPLAVVPFGVQIPATSMMLLGLAIMTRDGLLAGLGYLVIVVGGTATLFLT